MSHVIFQPQDLGVLISAPGRVSYSWAVALSCLAIRTVRWAYKPWTRRGSSHPEMSLSRPGTATSWCCRVPRSPGLERTRGRSTSSTSDGVWPESTRWLWRTAFVSSLLSTVENSLLIHNRHLSTTDILSWPTSSPVLTYFLFYIFAQFSSWCSYLIMLVTWNYFIVFHNSRLYYSSIGGLR